MEILKIYRYALQREQEGKRFFEQNAQRLSHAAAVEAFQALAAEEQKHIEFIQTQIKALEKGVSGDLATGLDFEKEGFFSQRASKEMLEQTIFEAMVPDLPILRMAYLIERDFAEFYEAYAQKTQGAAQQVLLMLSKWERTHEQLFKFMHDQAFETYAKMPWGG